MAKYRKKPIVIEAIEAYEAIQYATNNWAKLPDWLKDAYEAGNIIFTPGFVDIKTLEGWMRGDKYDMLICGVHNEIYPCKPDIFKKTYEPVT